MFATKKSVAQISRDLEAVGEKGNFYCSQLSKSGLCRGPGFYALWPEKGVHQKFPVAIHCAELDDLVCLGQSGRLRVQHHDLRAINHSISSVFSAFRGRLPQKQAL